MRRILICTVAMAATVAVPASAAPKPPGPYQCIPKKVGFKASGTFVSGQFTQTAGTGTAKRGDDRYDGTLTVTVKKANHKGNRGEQTYTLDDARVRFHPRSATQPKAGDRVKVGGRITKLGKKCDRSTFTPTVTVRKVDIKSAKPKS